ncbi:MAG: hypothetical protein DI629_20455 [Mesorhizobium amorphae]|nr:MAG: hypothetical protein DI629_20455 [Mesorhizobium amorphae]
MGNRFVTADTEFGNANVIRHAGRPFDSVLEMEERMVENWNAEVRRGDTVFHLGDLSANREASMRVLPRLNGEIRLIIGNHDKHLGFLVANRLISGEPMESRMMRDGDVLFMMSHRPMSLYNMFHANVSVHGHTHGLNPPASLFPGAGLVNVCVEQTGYRPLSWDELMPRVRAEAERASPCWRDLCDLSLREGEPEAEVVQGPDEDASPGM